MPCSSASFCRHYAAAFSIAFASIFAVFYDPDPDAITSGARKWSLVFVGIGVGAVFAALLQVGGRGVLAIGAAAVWDGRRSSSHWFATGCQCIPSHPRHPRPTSHPTGSPTPSTTWARSWAAACACSCSRRCCARCGPGWV